MIDHVDRLVRQYENGGISRRALLGQLGALVALGGLGRRAAAAEDASPTFQAVGLNHIALNVTDVPRSREFYKRRLGLVEMDHGGEQSSFLECGDHFLALFKADKPSMDHYCYSIRKYDPADAVRRLKDVGLDARRVSNRVYFDDPDGLEVQVAAAP